MLPFPSSAIPFPPLNFSSISAVRLVLLSRSHFKYCSCTLRSQDCTVGFHCYRRNRTITPWQVLPNLVCRYFASQFQSVTQPSWWLKDQTVCGYVSIGVKPLLGLCNWLREALTRFVWKWKQKYRTNKFVVEQKVGENLNEIRWRLLENLIVSAMEVQMSEAGRFQQGFKEFDNKLWIVWLRNRYIKGILPP